MGSDAYLSAVKSRRSYYELEPKSTISDDKILDIIEQTLLHTPSTFNSQSTRIVVLLKEDHVRLWNDIVKPAVKAVMPAEHWPTTEQKLSGFQNSYGTVRFYPNSRNRKLQLTLPNRSCCTKIRRWFPLYRSNGRCLQTSFHSGLSIQTQCMHMFVSTKG